MNTLPTPTPTPTPHSLQTDLAFCISPDNHRGAGVRIVEPKPGDPHANRGHLYVLLDLISQGPEQNSVLRQALNAVQQSYYTAPGSQSAVLREAIMAANRVIRQANLGRRQEEIRTGITCAALLRNQLTVASAGPGLVILAANQAVDQLSPLPEEFGPPLGGVSEADVSVTRHTVNPGDVLFLGESEWLSHVPFEELARTLAFTDPHNRFDAVEHLREQSNPEQILGLLVILSEPAAAPEVEAEEERPAAVAPSRNLPRGLPTAVGATPPIRDVPPAPPPRRTPPASPASLADQARQSAAPAEARAIPTVPRREPEPEAEGMRAALGQRAGQVGPWLQSFVRRMLPDKEGRARPRAALESPPPRRPQRPTAEASAPSEASPRVGPSPLAASAQAVADYTPPPRAKGGRARLFVSLAVLLLVLSVIGVATIYLSGASNRADAEQLIALVEANLVQAKGLIDAGQEGAARSLLTDGQNYLQRAAEIVGNTAQIADLNAQIQVELQAVLQIYLLYGLDIPLERFSSGDPQEVVVADQDVYILDTGRQVIEHLRLDARREVVEERTGAILREGDSVGGVVVGRLVDVAWQPRVTGFSDKPSLLILDRNNRIFRYNRIDGASLLSFAKQNEWQTMVQMAVYGDGWVYLADQGRQQILRYTPAGTGGYDGDPAEWFAPGAVVNLTGLRTMRIDGNIWLLYQNGQVLRYFNREQVAFALESNVGQIEDPRDLGVGNSRLYIADAGGARVLVYNKETGAYLHQFQAVDARTLQGLRSVFVDEGTGKIFLLTSNALYQQSLPR